MSYSTLINDRVHFGQYPTTLKSTTLETLKVNTLIDLTTPREVKKADKYDKGGINYIQYSISNRKAPINIITFNDFIDDLVDRYQKGGIFYIHCRGGHGRSGIVCIVLLHRLTNKSVEECIECVDLIYKQRPNIDAFAIKNGILQILAQKRFIEDYFSNEVKFYRGDRLYFEFSNFYRCNVSIDGKTYPTTEHYYQSRKFSNTCPLYAEIIVNQTTPGKAFYLGRKYKQNRYKWMRDLNRIIDKYSHATIDQDWDSQKLGIMEKALKAKFSNPSMKKVLLSSKDKHIYEDSSIDSFWGLGKDGKGKNMLGSLLMKLRDELRS